MSTDVFCDFVVGLCNRLQDVGQFRADFGSLIFQFVVFFFQLAEVIFFFVAVRIFDSPDFLFVLIEILLLAFLTRGAGVGLNFVGDGVGVSALVGEKILDG